MIWKPGETMKKNNDAFLVPSLKRRSGVIAVVFGVLVAAPVIDSQAQTLSVPNSSIGVDTTNGLYNWTLNGTSEMDVQSFYYSVGSGNLFTVGSISPGSTTSQTSSSL